VSGIEDGRAIGVCGHGKGGRAVTEHAFFEPAIELPSNLLLRAAGGVTVAVG
jgi:hypothetical protein